MNEQEKKIENLTIKAKESIVFLKKIISEIYKEAPFRENSLALSKVNEASFWLTKEKMREDFLSIFGEVIEN